MNTPEPSRPFETEKLLELRAEQRRRLLSLPLYVVEDARKDRIMGPLPIDVAQRSQCEDWVRRHAEEIWDSRDDSTSSEFQTWSGYETVRVLRAALARRAGDKLYSGRTAKLALDLDNAEGAFGQLEAPSRLERIGLAIVPLLDLADELAGDGFVDERERS